MSTKKPTEEELKRAQELIQNAGGTVKFPVKYIKKTFSLEESAVNEFLEFLDREHLKYGQALQEAMKMWLEAKKPKTKK